MTPGAVVEFLTFEVDEVDQPGFLAAEEAIWTRALEAAPGFISKQRWRSEDDPRLVHAVIWWESLEIWKSFPDAEVARLDEEMGPWLRPATCHTYSVV